MVFPDASLAAWPGAPAWSLITRLGEAQILLPALLVACAALAWRGGAGRLALGWLAATAAATLLTTASKVAFIGYGWGWPGLDFTGISGHAMFAAAIWPPLLWLAAGPLPAPWQGAGWLLGAALALLVGLSRLAVQAHSASEVLAGLLLGGAASALVLWVSVRPLRSALPMTPFSAPLQRPLWRGLPLALLLWAVLSVAAAPPSRSHDWVTRLALAASGRSAPFLRNQWPQALPALRSWLPAASLQSR